MSRTIDLWEPVGRPEGPADWFAEADRMPAFDPSAGADFSLANAWWLASLCRIAYTPDERESARRWHRGKPARREFLESQTPFREVLNVHKTASHAALYHLEGMDGAVLCFRGTNKLRQWILNLTAMPVTWSRGGGDPALCVHHGFQLLFDRMWPLIEPSLARMDGPLHLTGHSLGGAFAKLAAAALPERSVAALVTFGSPRVGNLAFAARLASSGTPHHRVVNCHDIVTRLPMHEPLLGDRDYRHASRPVILGTGAGAIHFGELPESECDPGWMPERPLRLLARGFKSPAPPEGILAHLPIAYERKLAAALSAGARIPGGCA